MPLPSLPSLSARLRQLLAPDCVICGIAPADPPGSPVCTPCRADYFPTEPPRCRICANRLPGEGVCGRCLSRWPRFDATLVLGDYAPPLDAMIAAVKFRARLDLARAFGLLLADRAQHLEPAALVALPLAPPRLRERGYNQAQEIARAIAARLRRPLLRNALVRIRHCPSQQGLGLAQRRTNVRGAFQANPGVAGLHLLLVDDVLTSGSTLDEAAGALKAAGALRVTNLVVARTP
jgi:ComF family protein